MHVSGRGSIEVVRAEDSWNAKVNLVSDAIKIAKSQGLEKIALPTG